ncbi:hypothetical protein C7974DRAFT_381266 [Boeremia exigua]|uniref:uncharacterized protein n=1 Tax=Boeremia exigua TaxID=749465 RepID=UPI001E8E5E73|nr:uncharacterized protein C7974DRAFT_381266 [Boeremia exigua]KAH6612763.1 hypothetical protein C7974DRAFT_381266 [Boeremia exigua]
MGFHYGATLGNSNNGDNLARETRSVPSTFADRDISNVPVIGGLDEHYLDGEGLNVKHDISPRESTSRSQSLPSSNAAVGILQISKFVHYVTLNQVLHSLYGPHATAAKVRRTGTSVIVNALLSPPAESYDYVGGTYTLDLDWAMDIIGNSEFEDSPLGRKILRLQSPLRQQIMSGVSLPQTPEHCRVHVDGFAVKNCSQLSGRAVQGPSSIGFAFYLIWSNSRVRRSNGGDG